MGDRGTGDDGYHHYNGAKRTLWTDDDVVHEGSRVRVEGKGLIVYLDKKSLKLKSQVKATINDDEYHALSNNMGYFLDDSGRYGRIPLGTGEDQSAVDPHSI